MCQSQDSSVAINSFQEEKRVCVCLDALSFAGSVFCPSCPIIFCPMSCSKCMHVLTHAVKHTPLNVHSTCYTCTNAKCIASFSPWFQISWGSVRCKGMWSKQNHLGCIWREPKKIAEESHGIWSVNRNPTLNTRYLSLSPSLSLLLQASYLEYINKYYDLAGCT